MCIRDRYWTVKRMIGSCDFIVLFYLLSCFMFVFLQDVFTMFSGKPMGAVSVFMTGNYLCQPGGRWWCEVVIAIVVSFVVVLFWRLSIPCFLSIDIVIKNKYIHIFIIKNIFCTISNIFPKFNNTNVPAKYHGELKKSSLYIMFLLNKMHWYFLAYILIIFVESFNKHY